MCNRCIVLGCKGCFVFLYFFRYKRCSDVKPTHTLVRELVRYRYKHGTPLAVKGLTPHLDWGDFPPSCPAFRTGSYGCLWH